MNAVWFFAGVLILILSVLLEVGERASGSRTWLRARVLIVLGVAVTVLSILYL